MPSRLHHAAPQRKYIEKVVERFMPDGPLRKVERNLLPYSPRLQTSW